MEVSDKGMGLIRVVVACPSNPEAQHVHCRGLFFVLGRLHLVFYCVCLRMDCVFVCFSNGATLKGVFVVEKVW